jgi:TrmH family RNA methyltransferase
MLSKAKLKYIRSLELKKNRRAEHVFVAEGPKVVGDMLPHFHCRLLVAIDEWHAAHPKAKADEKIHVTNEELTHASFLKTPQEVMAIFEYKDENQTLDTSFPQTELCLALDDVQDPGNLGTIIRLADWFGIRHIFCSLATADAYNPKVVQATMGALARIHIHYTPLPAMLSKWKEEGIPLYGTFLDGENLYEKPLTPHGIIIMGNEGNGISAEVASYVNERLLIPNYPMGEPTSESLNVATATAIICAEFRRRIQ